MSERKSTSRTFSLIRTLGSTAVRAGSEAIKRKLSSQEATDSPSAAALRLVAGLDHLKGAAMKLGQFMSMYGDEDFLPKSWRTALSTLQSQATPRPWQDIEPILKAALPNYGEFARIDPQAVHAASMGQVHKGWLNDGSEVAIKVRYPGLQENVKADLKNIKSALKFANFMPKGQNFDAVFAQAERLFLQELDFEKERNFYEFYAEFLKNDPVFVVPQSLPRHCAADVLTTTWQEGKSLSQVLKDGSLNQSFDKNQLGKNLLRLVFTEIFLLRKLQTDPNPGNFLVTDEFKIVLLDFGATQELSPEFVKNYRDFARSCLERNHTLMLDSAMALKLLFPEDSKDVVESFLSMMTLVFEPFHSAHFSWKNCQITKRAHYEGIRFVKATRFRPPPPDLVFFNRRILGLEFFLEELGCEFDARSVLEPFLG